jgi:hypothetical protein
MTMPWSVRVAAAALVAVLLVQGALVAFLLRQGHVAWAQSLGAVGAMGLLLYGVLSGARLGWLFGRFVGFLMSALLAVSAFSLWRQGTPPRLVAIPLLGLGLPLLVVALALGRDSAQAWFRLVCPSCGADRPRNADLLFRRARCRQCRTTW